MQNNIDALAIDVSPDAVKLAQENARSHRIIPPQSIKPPSRSTFDALQADIFSPTFLDLLSSHPRYPFSALTCNPPYIPRSSYRELDPSVRDWEDPLALIGESPSRNDDTDGLAFYHRIADLLIQSPRLLAPQAWVALEVGVKQADIVERLFREQGILQSSTVWKDAWGIGRAVVGQT